MPLSADIQSITKSVTKKWTKQRKAEERSSQARPNRQYIYSDRVNQSEVADEVIPRAYLKASGSRGLAHARQIFYAARKEIQDRTGRPLNSVYFTQNLLPKFMNRNPELTAGWWVVYDARGHLTEPHTDESVALGTLDVESFLAEVTSHTVKPVGVDLIETDYPTKGPRHRYSAILFIEKEGFNPLFKESKLQERYDIAIMSTKGQTVVACRRLVDELCHTDVPVLVLHDFDKEGFLISERLTSVSEAAYESDRVRYEFQNEINVIDLGLRLTDVEEWGLESESVKFTGGFAADTIATKEEQDFLRGNRRVELNAFTSDDFITWIEGKLDQHGIKKVIPSDDTLDDAFRRAYQITAINHHIEEFNEEAEELAISADIPDDLRQQIQDELEANPESSWDDVVGNIAGEAFNDADDSAC